MKISSLPPLNVLVPFEAAARHLSFSRAAQELNITQSAVSKRIKLLETHLGCRLFLRANRRIQLTSPGARLYHCAHDTLRQLARVTGEIREAGDNARVTVATTSAMASLWLLPRIGGFRRDNDDLDLRIVASDRVRDLSKLDCDIALYYCRTPPVGTRITPLFPEEVFPVCSPAYLRRVGPLESAEQLHDCTLLHLEEADVGWISWPEWFKQIGVEMPTSAKRLDINNYAMLLQAAVMDQGVALGWAHLVDDLMRSGALVRPVAPILRTSAKFCLIERTHEISDRACVLRFRDWVARQGPCRSTPRAE